ncbi:Fic family protein [Patescibacteria group bacterium]|nr:Fic family protein [Patescibacteria group bacterium]
MKKASTKPKGATSYKETAFGIIPRSKLLKLEIEGTKRGLDYIYDLISSDKDVKITPLLICKLHEISFQWIFPDWAGKYRKIQVTISGKETPQFFLIPELMINLCNDLEERLKYLPNPKSSEFIIEAVKLLTWFQHRFVFIHPFQDYNGRIARMLTILILLKLDLPGIEIKTDEKSDRKQYITAMQQADKGNLSLLEDLISKTLQEGLRKIVNK